MVDKQYKEAYRSRVQQSHSSVAAESASATNSTSSGVPAGRGGTCPLNGPSVYAPPAHTGLSAAALSSSLDFRVPDRDEASGSVVWAGRPYFNELGGCC